MVQTKQSVNLNLANGQLICKLWGAKENYHSNEKLLFGLAGILASLGYSTSAQTMQTLLGALSPSFSDPPTTPKKIDTLI